MANSIKVENLTISAELLSASAIDGKYDKTGGEISGDVYILSGSFSGGTGAVAAGANSFAYGTGVSAIGENSYAAGKDSIAGCYGWYYDHIDFQNNVFYLTLSQPATTYTSSLTGEGTVDPSFDSGLAVGNVISYVNKAKFDMELSVTAVDGNKITVQPFKNTSQYKLDESTPNHDDWSIFCPDRPTIGQIWFGEASYVEGLDCKAVNAYSHAEGRKNLAYGQYSHIEGYKNRGAYAAHAEGKGNYADGQYSHAEGWNNRTTNNCSHAEGNETSAINTCAHSQGYHTLASGEYSLAGGKYTTASGSQSIAFGNSSEANGGSSFASGWKCVADKDNTYAFGLSAIADHKESFVWNAKSNERYVSNGQGTFNINPKDGAAGVFVGTQSLADLITNGSSAELTNYLDKRTGGAVSGDVGVLGAFTGGTDSTADGKNTFAYGNAVSATGNNSQAFGNKTYANGYCSFACGDSVSATNSEAFAIGWKTIASGTYAFAGGESSKATAAKTFAFGTNVSATTSESFAIGYNNEASNQFAFAGGQNSKAKGKQAFVFGNNAEANGGSALAHGYRTIADKDNTYCLGLNAKAKDLQSFVWSGIYSPSDVKYESRGESTFCINPKNGISGFYIGSDNFVQCVLSAIAGMNPTQISQLKTKLGIS